MPTLSVSSHLHHNRKITLYKLINTLFTLQTSINNPNFKMKGSIRGPQCTVQKGSIRGPQCTVQRGSIRGPQCTVQRGSIRGPQCTVQKGSIRGPQCTVQ